MQSFQCGFPGDQWHHTFRAPEGRRMVAASDGSGGEGRAAKDPRLRRVGWAFVVYDGDSLVPWAWSFGGLEAGLEEHDPESQTVPLSELVAITMLATRTSGDVLVYCDCKYVCDLFGKDARHWPLEGSHSAWLAALRERLLEREGRFEVVKFDSHKSHVLDLVGFYGNELADNMAKLAAQRHQLDQDTLDKIAEQDQL